MKRLIKGRGGAGNFTQSPGAGGRFALVVLEQPPIKFRFVVELHSKDVPEKKDRILGIYRILGIFRIDRAIAITIARVISIK